MSWGGDIPLWYSDQHTRKTARASTDQRGVAGLSYIGQGEYINEMKIGWPS